MRTITLGNERQAKPINNTAVCIKCGRVWRISVNKKIPTSGYICPHCESSESESAQKKKHKEFIKYLMLTLLGVLIFIPASKLAFTERGYMAIGGEGGLLLLPFFYWLISACIKDIKEIYKEDKGLDYAESKNN